MRAFVIDDGQPDLAALIAAINSSCSFTNLLDRRQQHPDQDANNCNHY